MPNDLNRQLELRSKVTLKYYLFYVEASIKVIMRYNVSEDVIYARQESILKGYRTLKRRLFSIKRIVLWSSCKWLASSMIKE